MTKSAKRGDTATAPGCQAGGTPGTSPAGQREQIWNSLGLRSWIRTDADSARIEQLKQACANVPSGSNIWTSGAGTYSSSDFGMPDPAKCRLAASCTAGQTFDGSACVSAGTNTAPPVTSSSCDSALTALLGSGCHYMYNDSSGSQIYCDGPMTKSAKRGDAATTSGCTPGSGAGTACPSGQYWYVPPSGGAGYCKATSSTDCPSGQYWNGTSCVASTSTSCPSGQYWYVPPSGGAGYCKATSSTDCPSGQYWNGTACVSSTATTGSCPAGWHAMGSYCMSDSDSSQCQPFGGGASYTCSGYTPSSTACPSGQYWYVPPSGGAGYCKATSSTDCPSGQYWNGTACVSSTTTTCPADQYWNGTSCVPNTTSTYTPPANTTTCPSDQYWNGTSCVPNTTSTYTPPATTTTCPSGQYWNGTACVSSSPAPQSLVGTIISAFVSAFVALFTR